MSIQLRIIQMLEGACPEEKITWRGWHWQLGCLMKCDTRMKDALRVTQTIRGATIGSVHMGAMSDEEGVKECEQEETGVLPAHKWF